MINMATLIPPGRIQEREIDALADLREMETLRRALRRELRVHGSQRGLAREVGVSRIVLRKFLTNGSRPAAGNLARIREWAHDRPEIYTPFGCVLLASFVRELPASHRAQARHHLARTLAKNYEEAGENIPEWLGEELGSMHAV